MPLASLKGRFHPNCRLPSLTVTRRLTDEFFRALSEKRAPKMKQQKVSKIFAALAATVIVAGLSASVRADIAYGYAEQTISNVSLTVSSGTLTGVTLTNTSTQDGATVNGIGISKADPLDAPQTYFGPSAPPENTFTRTAPGVLPGGTSFT